MPGDHYLQLQEVFNASHLQCMVAPVPGEVPVWVLEIYTGVLVFDPIKGGNAVRHDRLYSIVPLASKSNGVEVQNYGRQLEEVTVMAAPASIGGNPETVAVDGAGAAVRLHKKIQGHDVMYLLVLSVDTAVAEGRLQRVAYQVTTLSSEPLDPLYKNRYVLPFTVRAEPGKTI